MKQRLYVLNKIKHGHARLLKASVPRRNNTRIRPSKNPQPHPGYLPANRRINVIEKVDNPSEIGWISKWSYKKDRSFCRRGLIMPSDVGPVADDVDVLALQQGAVFRAARYDGIESVDVLEFELVFLG